MKSVTAENIKNIIKEKGLKQKSVAKRAGYDEKAFNNMLNGRKLITDCDIIPIAKILDATPNQLFGYEEKT